MSAVMQFLGRLALVLTCLVFFLQSAAADDNKCPEAQKTTLDRLSCQCQHTKVTNESTIFKVTCVNSSQSVVPNELQELSDLISLQFTDNNIAVLESLPNLDQLQVLNLANNNMYFIMDTVFQNYSNLKTLKLENNRLRGLSNRTFFGLHQLTFLYLSNNPLYEITAGVFSALNAPMLEEVYLSNCALYKIEAGAFQSQGKLQKLHLSHNNFFTPPAFSKGDNLTGLNTLNISHCKIVALPHNFSGTPSLNHLDLSYNLLQQIGLSVSFQGLAKEVHLDLSHNNISFLRASAFANVFTVDQLDLSHNSLQSLYWENWFGADVHGMILSDNPWNCSCINVWMIEEDQKHTAFWSSTNITNLK